MQNYLHMTTKPVVLKNKKAQKFKLKNSLLFSEIYHKKEIFYINF